MTTKARLRMIAGQLGLSVDDYGITPLAEGAGGTDARDIIMQAQADVAARGGGICYVPPADIANNKYYRITKPLYARDNVILMGAGPASLIRNDRPTQVAFPDQACWMWGSQTNSRYTDDYTQYDLDNVTAGDSEVTCATVAQAGNFTVGKLIVISSGDHFVVGGTQDISLYYLLTRVISVDATTGVVGLAHSIDRDLVPSGGGRKPRAYNPNEIGVLGDFGDQGFATQRAGIENIAFKSNGATSARGGALECWMNNVTIDGRDGIYGNMFARCNFDNVRVRCYSRSAEIKMGSHDTSITNYRAQQWDNSGVQSATSGYEVGESSRNISMNGFDINLGDLTTYSLGHPISIGDATGCRVQNGRLTAPKFTKRLITFTGTPAGTPDDKVDVEDNWIDNVVVECEAPSHFFVFDQHTPDKIKRCGIRRCTFKGAPTSTVGILSGRNCEIVGNLIEPWTEESIQFSAAETIECTVRDNAGLGEWENGANGYIFDMQANRVTGNYGTRTQNYRENNLFDNLGTEDIVSTTPNNIVNSSTYPANTFRLAEVIVVKVYGKIDGTTAAKDLRVRAITGVSTVTLATISASAGQNGDFSMEGQIIIESASATGAYHSMFSTFLAGRATPYDEELVRTAGIDLTANTFQITVEAWVANSADNIDVRSIYIQGGKIGFATKVA